MLEWANSNKNRYFCQAKKEKKIEKNALFTKKTNKLGQKDKGQVKNAGFSTTGLNCGDLR
jgi:hypothetical protein